MTAIKKLPRLSIARTGDRQITAAIKINGEWVKKTAANAGLAQKYIEHWLSNQGWNVPNAWDVKDYGDCRENIPPIDENGLLSPRDPSWLGWFKFAVAEVQAVTDMQRDTLKFRDDVDRVLIANRVSPAFQKRQDNDAPMLTLAGIKDPTIRAPRPGEGEKRKLKGLNGFERDSQGRAYFEEGSTVRATEVETFNEYREEAARPSAETPEEVAKLIEVGLAKSELRPQERRLLRIWEAQNKVRKETIVEKRTYPMEVYSAGRVLGKYASENGQDSVWWYKLGVVAMLRKMNLTPNPNFEGEVQEKLKAAGHDPDTYLSTKALEDIAEAKAAQIPA